MKRNVVFYPNIKNSENDFVKNLVRAIKDGKENTTIIPLPSLKELYKNEHDFNEVWLNWFENFPQNKKLFLRQLFRKTLVIYLLKFRKKKIYTIFHNKIPHESILPFLNKWFYKLLLKNTNRIIILSDDSRKYIEDLIGAKGLKKIVKIFHPTYEIVPLDILRKADEFTVLYSGFLRPYKNIELIFELANAYPFIKFIIAGKAIDSEYEDKLVKESKGIGNIKLITKFLSDKELVDLMQTSSIMLLPYDIKSSLNSGMVYYSFSKGINVIIPEIGSVNEFEYKDLIYSYSYDSDANHLDNLINKLLEAKNDFENDKLGFFDKVNILQKEVSRNTVEVLSEVLRNNNLI